MSHCRIYTDKRDEEGKMWCGVCGTFVRANLPPQFSPNDGYRVVCPVIASRVAPSDQPARESDQ